MCLKAMHGSAILVCERGLSGLVIESAHNVNMRVVRQRLPGPDLATALAPLPHMGQGEQAGCSCALRTENSQISGWLHAELQARALLYDNRRRRLMPVELDMARSGGAAAPAQPEGAALPAAPKRAADSGVHANGDHGTEVRSLLACRRLCLISLLFPLLWQDHGE